MRPIDADEFLSKIDPDEYYHTNEIRDMVADTLAASNDPLTLEELREMDGEPVWVISLDGQSEPCWMLVDAEYELCREAHGGLAIFDTYGKTWLAYRHKPEEIQHEGLD